MKNDFRSQISKAKRGVFFSGLGDGGLIIWRCYMAPSPQEDGGNTFFVVRSFNLENICERGRLYGGNVVFKSQGVIIQGLVVSIHLKENLPADNIKYLLMT